VQGLWIDRKVVEDMRKSAITLNPGSPDCMAYGSSILPSEPFLES
jgi:hypothetical protein